MLFVPFFQVMGCKQEAPPPPDSLRDVAERGPLKLVVEASPRQVWLADPITVTVRMHTPEDFTVALPEKEAFGDLQVVRVEERDARPAAEGGLEWQRTFMLESFSSGALEIPPLVVKYRRKDAGPGDAGDAAYDELSSDTLRVEVRSALTTQDSVVRPRDITATVVPPRRLTRGEWLAIAAISAAAIALTFLIIAWIRSRRRRPTPPILPEVWALRELASLSAANLVEAGDARAFYYRLSEIVRTYTERKFALAAPEMTTDEFLRELSRNREALPYDADRLRAFMQACDIVKYAAYHPRREDADDALATARAFVHATAAATATPPGPRGSQPIPAAGDVTERAA